jgi:6-phosphogluconolactonase
MPVPGSGLGEEMSNKTCGILVLAGLVAISTLLMNCGSSSSRPAGVLFVASQGENTLGSYAIDLNNGNLSKIQTSTATGSAPTIVVMGGNSIFALNTGGTPSISGYVVNTNGTLAQAATTSLSVPNPVAMAIDPAGKFLFVASQGSVPSPTNCPQDPACPAISAFTTSSGSANLTPVGGTPLPLSKIPTAISSIVDPKGNTLLYVTNTKNLQGVTDNTLSQFLVSSSGTIASEENNGPYFTTSDPTAVLAVRTAPAGAQGGVFVYVTNATTNDVNVYQLCTVLSSVCTQQSDIDHFFLNQVGSPVSVAGTKPVALVVDPSNNFVYIVDHDSSDVRGFRINPTTGGLTALSSAIMSTGFNPVALTIHSTGKFLYVSNNGASSISGFNVDTTSGTLSQPINLISTANPYGLVAR